MTLLNGTALPHDDYLRRFRRPQSSPTLWRWARLASDLELLPHNERGTLALSVPGADEACDIVPGISIALQVVKAGEQTRPHTDSWWHLYLVQCGRGTVGLEAMAGVAELGPGDVLVIPAWCAHSFANPGRENLVLLRMQNLPQLSRLANLMSQEPDR